MENYSSIIGRGLARVSNVPHDRDEEPYRGLFNRLDEPHPDHGGRVWRDVHHVWQWGITDRDLISRASDLGYKLEYFRNCGPFNDLPRFEDHAMIFIKAARA